MHAAGCRGAVKRDDERLAAERGDDRAREPVRVHEAARSEVRHGAVHEPSGEIVRGARIGGREDCDTKWAPMFFRRLESLAGRNASHAQRVFGRGNEKLEPNASLPLPSMAA
jgi:hypothetical protein